MSIPAAAGQSQVKFKWNYTGGNGYYWAIDNVQITGIGMAVLSTVSPHSILATTASELTRVVGARRAQIRVSAEGSNGEAASGEAPKEQ